MLFRGLGAFDAPMVARNCCWAALQVARNFDRPLLRGDVPVARETKPARKSRILSKLRRLVAQPFEVTRLRWGGRKSWPRRRVLPRARSFWGGGRGADVGRCCRGRAAEGEVAEITRRCRSRCPPLCVSRLVGPAEEAGEAMVGPGESYGAFQMFRRSSRISVERVTIVAVVLRPPSTMRALTLRSTARRDLEFAVKVRKVFGGNLGAAPVIQRTPAFFTACAAAGKLSLGGRRWYMKSAIGEGRRTPGIGIAVGILRKRSTVVLRAGGE